ncbi:phosphatase PAP2 family protein [Novosphingobium rosa]|uniref:hypothetical protein n=1 Tax=Novosphingobium rosa TaxID=76978 RepID=UPI0008318CAE|nr:hypothetical protein [Novosphingobium rosa]
MGTVFNTGGIACIGLAAIALGAAAGGAHAQAPNGSPPGLPPEYRAYLAQSGLHREQLAPRPAPGSPRDSADRAFFQQTRKLEGTPRWTQAQADAGKGVLKAFACAAGTTLSAENAPRLVKLLSRYRTDMITLTRIAPQEAQRPYQRDKGAVCLTDKALTMAGNTPSIQSAWAWTIGLILGEALPARGDALMARARSYGDSAAICGFASVSEVMAGRDLAGPLLARARAEAEFRTDLAAAQQEVAHVAAQGSAPAEGCAAEAEATAGSVL